MHHKKAMPVNWYQVQSAKEGMRMVNDLRSRSQRIGGLEFLISRWLVMNSREKENAGDGGRARCLETLGFDAGSWFIAAS
jgi:hypothetical protein